ncbi:MAG: hypothetical protein LC800_21750 [Acidobacteria bacterium]|nr:hypothetical protein [Acidobacteriota bacterium]
MKFYNSFLIRCWSIATPTDGERAVYDIEHFQTGERNRADTLAQIQQWITDACQCARPERAAPQEGGGGEEG